MYLIRRERERGVDTPLLDLLLRKISRAGKKRERDGGKIKNGKPIKGGLAVLLRGILKKISVNLSPKL